ncbi:MAG: prepilin peptidase [Patescibacteria group bacterium]
MDALAFGIFGLIAGSFLNVVIVRRGAKSLGGRSACMSCGVQLPWYDMVPVFSWLALRGRCRSCGSRISMQYPLVEAGTACLFALMGAAPMGLLPRIGALPLLGLLIVIAVYDIRHTIIPDEWVYSFAGLTLVYQFIFPVPAGFGTALLLLAGPAAALPLFLLWLFSKGAWMGLGDPKLALGIGWLLGPLWGVWAVFFSFIIGALVSVLILLPLPYIVRFAGKTARLRDRVFGRGQGIARLNRQSARFTMKSEVPFGPFLVGSCIFVWFSLLYHIPLPL